MIIVSVIGFFAGVWPALSLSKLKPVQLLKLKSYTSLKHGNISLRHSLIVFQFVIAQFLLVSTIIVFNQIQFLFRKDVGYNSENILLIPAPKTNYLTHKAFAKTLESSSLINVVSVSGEPPTSKWYNSTTLSFSNNGNIQSTHVELKYGDPEFIDVYRIKVIAGRNIALGANDEVMINENYSKILGYTNPWDCVGQQIGRKRITGVMQDFNTKSLHSRIGPLVLTSDTSQIKYYHVLHSHSKIQETVRMLRKVWNAYFPDKDFSYQIYKEQLGELYSRELKIYNLMNYTSIIVIIVNCLGLFGLITFNTNKRAKEIAIRKINGANSLSIINLLTRDFLSLIAIGLIIVSPIAWYFLKDWLNSFAYHVPIDWKLFVLSALILFLITWITICSKSLIAALKNPIEFLRNSE